MQSHKRYEIDLADAKRLWADHLVSLAGEKQVRLLIRITIQRFLSRFAVAGEPVRLVIDEHCVKQWMIEDAAGKAVSYAAERLAILDQFLKVLNRAGLMEADFLAEYRVDRGKPSWRCLARALQAENRESMLAALRPAYPPAGPLTAFVRSYIELQRALGKDYRGQEIALNELDRFLNAQAILSPQALTPALVECWLGTLTCGVRTRIHKARFAHRFFEYLRSVSAVTNNPITWLLTSPYRLPRSSFKPFIFVQEQLAAILAEAKRLPENHMCSSRAATCTTMLTLLCALGLRHGEVRRLRLRDLDADRQVLFIAQTKFHKNRYVPFGPKVGQCLQGYLEVRKTLLRPFQDDDPLFVTKRRNPLCPATLLHAFRDILRTLGITGIPGQSPPRLHDIRHSFAVGRLLRWYREGVDVQSRLAALSTFMGHISLQSTEVYLTITDDLLREANVRFHRQFGSQFDEKGHP